MKIQAIQHVPSEGLGYFQQILDSKGAEVQTLLLGRDDIPHEFAADGLIVLGGPMSVYDPLPHLQDELRLIHGALEQRKPILGICLGSQLLAAALGSRVYPSGSFEIGWQPVTIQPDPCWAGAPQQFEAMHWHGDVFDLPSDAQPLAASAMTPLQGFRVGTAWGLLFHLEVDETAVRGMAAAFPQDLRRGGLTLGDLLENSAERFAKLREIGGTFFQRWLNQFEP